MKKRNFLSGISAKIALLTLAISGAFITGCYKDDGLDANSPGGGGQVLDDAVYTITGTVTDAETGDNIQGTVSYTDGTSKEVSFNGTYTLKIAKFTEDTKELSLTFKATDSDYNGGKEIVRKVVLNKVEDGNAVVYPVNVAMKKSPVPMKERPYSLTFIYKNAVTGEAITADITQVVKAANGNTVTDFSSVKAGDYTIKTNAVAGEYKGSITVLSLPYVESEKENDVINKIVEIRIDPADAEAEDTYTTLAGVVVDEAAMSLIVDKIELWKDGSIVNEKTIEKSANFAFTINNKETGNYEIRATIGNNTYKAGIYNVPTAGNQNITLVAKRPEVPMYLRPYKITFAYKNAVTGEAITSATSTPIPTDGEFEAGEHAITTTAKGFNSNITHITLEEVKSTKKNDFINKAIVITLTPEESKETFTTLSGVVINDKGQSVMAATVELLQGTTVIKKISNSASFAFTIKDKEEAGAYTVKTTVEGKEIVSGPYDVPACGNQVITVVFESEKPVELKDVSYDLTFKAMDKDAPNTDITNGTKFIFDSKDVTGSTVTKVAAGIYTLKAIREGYSDELVAIVLPVMKNETGKAEQTIIMYMAKDKAEEPTKVTLMGEVVDVRGNMIVAQSIKLNNSDKAVYNTNKFSFVVEKGTETSWMLTAKVSKITSDGKPLPPHTEYVTFNYTEGTTTINKEISIPLPANADGIIVIDNATPGDGEQGEVTPEVDPETGAVATEVKTEMKGDGTPEDKTTIVIREGTVIKGADNNPLVAPIMLTRDVKEEMNPTGDEEANIKQSTVLRSFYGSPDGAKFEGKPLEITFDDPYDKELGTLKLQYKTVNGWGISPTNDNDDVAIIGDKYTMLVSHFSQFRAAVVGELDNGTAGDNQFGTPYSQEVNQQNNTDQTQSLIIKFKKAESGAIYQSLDEAIAAEFKNEKAQTTVKATINNMFTSRGMSVKEAFEPKEEELKYAVEPYTLVKSIKVTTEYAMTTYKFTLNGKEVSFTVKSVKMHNIEAETVGFGHGHGHGHGGDLNAGGGIIVGE